MFRGRNDQKIKPYSNVVVADCLSSVFYGIVLIGQLHILCMILIMMVSSYYILQQEDESVLGKGSIVYTGRVEGNNLQSIFDT